MGQELVGLDPDTAHGVAAAWDDTTARWERWIDEGQRLAAGLALDVEGATAAGRDAAAGLTLVARVLRDRADALAAVTWASPLTPWLGGEPGGPWGRSEDDDAVAALMAWLGSGRRGYLVDELVGRTDIEWADLVAARTIVIDNRTVRYFDIEPDPGAGVIVVDFFIPNEGSFVLDGDDRGHVDPIFGPLASDDSRAVMVLDLEHGRGSVQFADTCTAWGGAGEVCNEARPIEMAGDEFVFERDPPVLPPPVVALLPGAILALGDVPNQVSVRTGGGRIEVYYDILNGMLPLGSVDGTFRLTRQGGGRYAVEELDADEYPSVGVYQFRRGEHTDVLLRRDSDGVTQAFPWWPDLSDWPDLPLLS